MTAKMRWGDSLDDEDDALPPPEVLGPDKNGIKQLITYKKNDKGETIKQTCRVRVVKVEKKIYKSALERKKWKKFGAAANQESEITVQANDDIMFEKTRIKQKSEQEKKVSDLQSALAGSDKSAVVGNLKDMLYKKRMERAMLAAKGLGPQPELPPAEDDSHLPSKPSAGGYVAPHLRGAGGAGSSGPDRKREENSVRVTNLSEDTTEQDLRDLFSVFGNIQRIYVAYDRDTRESRGFAFVNFMYREDAQRAINKLDGYGYDNLILRVEWAAPRSEREGGGGRR